MQTALTAPASGPSNAPAVLTGAAIAAVCLIAMVAAMLGSTFLLGLAAIVLGTIVLRVPVIGIMIYLVTFLFTYPEALRGVGNLTINNALGMILLPLMLVGFVREGSLWILRFKPMVLIGVGVAILVGSSVFYVPSDDAAADMAQMQIERSQRVQGPALIQTRDAGTKLVTRYAFLMFFVFFVRTPRDLKLVVGTILACLLMSYLNATAEVGPIRAAEGRVRVLGEVGSGLYSGRNPNKLAYFLLFCLTLLWYMRTRIKSAALYIPWLAGFALTFYMIPLTASRSGLLNLMLFCGIVLLEGRFNYRKVVGLAMVTIFIALQFGYQVNLLNYILPGDVGARLTNIDIRPEVIEEGVIAQGSAQGRQQTAAVAARMVPRHPFFGVGIGNFNFERAIVDPTGTLGPPHNSYLWAVTQGGLVTLGVYLAMFTYVFRSLRELERNYEARFREVDLGWLVRAMRTGMFGFLFFSLFADMWHHILFFVVIGMSLAVINVHRSYAETGRLYGAPVPTRNLAHGLAG